MNNNETQKKLEFVNQLLHKNPELQRQYNEFIKEKDLDDFNSEEMESFLLEEAGDLIQELNTLNISDPDWEYYTPRHSGYIEEWEARMHIAEDLVREVLEGYEAGLYDYLSRGKTDLALLIFTAGYDACLRTDLQDKYDELGDPKYFLKEEMREIQNRVIQKLQTLVFPDRQVFSFLEAFFNHFKKHHHTNEKYLRFFEPLLLILSGDKDRAEQMIDLLEVNQIPRRYIPRLSTELYKITKDTKKWKEEAEGLFEEDVEVARDLLTEYSQNSYTDFIRVARQLWQSGRYKKELAPVILESIDREQSPEFYKEVLLWLTSKERSIARYKVLREVLTPAEKEEFIQGHSRDQLFFTKILKQEERYDEILQLVRNSMNSWNLNKIIAPILEPYPKESFKILEQKILSTLETERGRSVYQDIVGWLRLARSIKGMNEQTNRLIHHLYNWKPALPALKDELRKAGMV